MQVTDTRFGDYTVRTIVTAPPYYENCFLVLHAPDKSAWLVDPGDSASLVLSEVARCGHTVKAILLTHGHPDHVGAVQDVVNALGIPVYAHQDEAVILDAAEEWGQMLRGRGVELPEITWFSGNSLPDVVPGMKVIATPGHTPGGVCYSFPGFTITGDTLFNHGIGRTDLPGGDSRQLATSLHTLLKTLDSEDSVFPGHGPAWKAGPAAAWWKREGRLML